MPASTTATPHRPSSPQYLLLAADDASRRLACSFPSYYLTFYTSMARCLAHIDGLRRERLFRTHFKRLLLREKRTSIRHERRRESTADGQRPTRERDG